MVEVLSQMQVLAVQLKWDSNRPRIQAHASHLRQDIERAPAAAKMAPPNYYAGLASGACVYCHVPRHRLAPSQSVP